VKRKKILWPEKKKVWEGKVKKTPWPGEKNESVGGKRKKIPWPEKK
jgi:hypothetical protein